MTYDDSLVANSANLTNFRIADNPRRFFSLPTIGIWVIGSDGDSNLAFLYSINKI